MRKHHFKHPKTRVLIYQKYNGHCAYCGVQLEGRFTVDHIEPLKRGYNKNIHSGLESFENYNPCCQSCNSSKSDFTLEQWRQEIYKKFDRVKRESSNFRLLIRMGIVPSSPNDFLFHFEKHVK